MAKIDISHAIYSHELEGLIKKYDINQGDPIAIKEEHDCDERFYIGRYESVTDFNPTSINLRNSMKFVCPFEGRQYLRRKV